MPLSYPTAQPDSAPARMRRHRPATAPSPPAPKPPDAAGSRAGAPQATASLQHGRAPAPLPRAAPAPRSEEHTSELQSLMRISYAVFCLKKKKQTPTYHQHDT